MGKMKETSDGRPNSAMAMSSRTTNISDRAIVTLRWSGYIISFFSSEPHTFYATFVANEFAGAQIRPGDTVLDLGANIGDYTLRASRLAGNDGSVLAIESSHAAVQLLRKNLIQNGITNVIVEEAFVGDPSTEATIVTDGSYETLAPIGGSTRRIFPKDLDKILERTGINRVDVLKIDIEGAEAAVLQHFNGLDKVRAVAVELHGPSGKEAWKILLEKGFRLSRYTYRDLIAHTLSAAVHHPASLLAAEAAFGFYATRSALLSLRGRPVVPALDRMGPYAIWTGERSES